MHARLLEEGRRLRSAATRFHPRGRRWLRLLDSLKLDPDRLSLPLSDLGPRDFIICGAPRSGTTFLAAQLFRPPDLITLVEPWDGFRLPPAELFGTLRRKVEQGESMEMGKLDVRALTEDREVRWRNARDQRIEIPQDGDFKLGIKWPVFWRYLDYLSQSRFLVCVRSPFGVVASYKRVGGRLGAGLEYDVAFNRKMNDHLLAATRDPARRRALLYEYVTSRLLPHIDQSNVMLVHYERWFEQPDVLLSELGSFLERKLDGLTARIRAPRSESRLSAPEVDWIRRECTSATALGYDLDPANLR